MPYFEVSVRIPADARSLVELRFRNIARTRLQRSTEDDVGCWCRPDIRGIIIITNSVKVNGDSAASTRTAPRSVTDIEGFDRGTGTGEPTESVAHLLRVMKSADDGYNARDWPLFLYKLHREDVVVHSIGAPETHGHAPHLADMEMWINGFPDMRVHNDPYDIQFGQGEWTVAIGKLSGSFTKPLTLPGGKVVQPTGKSFLTFFTTIARWQNDRMVSEYVLYDTQDIMTQIGAG